MKYDIENNFNYHAPNKDKIHRHENLREILKGAAIGLDAFCPNSPEKTLALRKLEEAMFWANAAIARNPLEGTDGH